MPPKDKTKLTLAEQQAEEERKREKYEKDKRDNEERERVEADRKDKEKQIKEPREKSSTATSSTLTTLQEFEARLATHARPAESNNSLHQSVAINTPPPPSTNTGGASSFLTSSSPNAATTNTSIVHAHSSPGDVSSYISRNDLTVLMEQMFIQFTTTLDSKLKPLSDNQEQLNSRLNKLVDRSATPRAGSPTTVGTGTLLNTSVNIKPEVKPAIFTQTNKEEEEGGVKHSIVKAANSSSSSSSSSSYIVSNKSADSSLTFDARELAFTQSDRKHEADDKPNIGSDGIGDPHRDFIAWLDKLIKLIPFHRQKAVYKYWFGINSPWQRMMTYFWIGMKTGFHHKLFFAKALIWWNEQRYINGLSVLAVSTKSVAEYKPGLIKAINIEIPSLSCRRGDQLEDFTSTAIDLPAESQFVAHLPIGVKQRVTAVADFPFVENAEFTRSVDELAFKYCQQQLRRLAISQSEDVVEDLLVDDNSAVSNNSLRSSSGVYRSSINETSDDVVSAEAEYMRKLEESSKLARQNRIAAHQSKQERSASKFEADNDKSKSKLELPALSHYANNNSSAYGNHVHNASAAPSVSNNTNAGIGYNAYANNNVHANMHSYDSHNNLFDTTYRNVPVYSQNNQQYNNALNNAAFDHHFNNFSNVNPNINNNNMNNNAFSNNNNFNSQIQNRLQPTEDVLYSMATIQTISFGNFGRVRKNGVIPAASAYLPAVIKNVALATREATPSYYNQKADKFRLIVLEIKAKLNRQPFSGDEMAAPIYFQEYLVEICKADVSAPDAVAIMVDTTTSSARDWVTDTVNRRMDARVDEAEDFVFIFLLREFKSHYLGPHVVNKLKKMLTDISMHTQLRASVQEMETFQGRYLRAKRCLMICDLTQTEGEQISRVIDSLPSAYQMQVALNKNNYKTTEEVFKHVQALAAVFDRTSKQPSVLVANAAPHPRQRMRISNNAIDIGYGNEYYLAQRSTHSNYDNNFASSYTAAAVHSDNDYIDEVDSADSPAELSSSSSYPIAYQQYVWDTEDIGTGEAVDVNAMRFGKSNVEYLTCFHCGGSGHLAGDCARNDGKTEQSYAGKMAYLKYQRETGSDKPYDAALVKQRANERRQARGEAEANNNRNKDSAKQVSFRSTPTASTSNKNASFNKNNPSNAAGKQKVVPATTRSDRLASNRSSSTSSSSSSSSSSRNDKHRAISNNAISVVAGNDHYADGYDRDSPPSPPVEHLENGSINILDNGIVATVMKVDDSPTATITATQATQEGKYAGSLCIPIALEGIPMPDPGLVDQGCNRGTIRLSAFENYGIKDKVQLEPLQNYYMRGSTNELIPVVGRFNTEVTTDGKDFSYSCFYVVADNDKSDLICDVILGRSTIATSNYPLVDTRTGQLMSLDGKQYVQCLEACSGKRDNGKPIIRAKLTSEGRPVLSL